ncbi:hypothetical protein FHW67_004229, partial [Herbaspirillum sp. Sphag1AN]|uniref:hypothetical protein n=1 Tax=unclassified Herbaspirillum TaxID=2624150 RepID=UPI00161D71DB
MNQHLYRIVLNASTGVASTVAETTGCRFTTLAISLALLLGSVTLVQAQAQIVADPNAAGAQRPVIDNTANGLPLVQIAAPNASGLSHNQ